MILGVILARKSYPWLKYLSVVLIVSGVAAFMYKDKGGKVEEHPLGWGEILLVCETIAQARGPLECQGGYQAQPKIHVIRVVFQDQALYARTLFRGAKTCKIGKKSVFLVI